MTETRLWTAEEAAAATGGEITGPWTAHGVSIDSRTIQPGDLFVALQGPNFDAHRFIPQALAKGAAAVVATHLPAGTPANAPALLVPDTLAALEALGRAARTRSRARVIAVTGSVGKTGTKEALRACLSAQGKTHASLGSFNNHWGVPLSLARLPADADFAVFELGMNHPGEIARLTAMVRPDVAVITTIAAAHTAFFRSLEQIAEAKAEIFAGVRPGGAAVLPADNPYYARLAEHARAAGVGRIVAFGRDARAEARLVEASLHADRSTVTARVYAQTYDYALSLPGAHWVDNSLAVLAAVAAAGADVGRAAGEMARLRPVKGRGERHAVRLAGGGMLTVIDDSYNANPSSMRAAIDVLAQAREDGAGRLIAALGDMLELGERSRDDHAGLAEPLRAAGIDLVFTSGPAMAALDAALPAGMRGRHAEDAGTLAGALAAATRPGDTVLVKGSAGARMGQVVQALLDLDQADLPKAANGS